MYNKIKIYKLICKLGDTILHFRSLDKGDKRSKRTKATVIKKKPINGASSPPLNKKNKRKPEPSTATTANRYVCLFDGVLCHFQQYFSYIVAVSFIGGGLGENQRPVTSHLQT
jgi:hypothetical protein